MGFIYLHDTHKNARARAHTHTQTLQSTFRSNIAGETSNSLVFGMSSSMFNLSQTSLIPVSACVSSSLQEPA